jgi:hypothetical protein
MTTARVYHPDFGWFEPRGTMLCVAGARILAPPTCPCPDCAGGSISLHPRDVLALPEGCTVAPSQLSARAGRG